MLRNSQKKGSFQAEKQNVRFFMQNADFQTNSPQQSFDSDRVVVSSILEEIGCINKGWIFSKLKPNREYRTEVINTFFTEERLRRCGIKPDDLVHIRYFSVEASFVIVSDLLKHGFKIP